MIARTATILTAVIALGCARSLPPLGEAVVIVDTDLPVPGIVSRLRVDLYTADRSTWYASREIPTPDASGWPVSFGVFDPDTTTPRSVVLRLRAYPSGVVRDYRGERYTPRATSGGASDPAPIAPIPPGETPRLLDADGNDITPASEPDPLVAVDLLTRIDLQPGTRGSLRIELVGACAGTMADLAGGSTCTDAENVLVPIPVVTALDPDLTLPTTSIQGAFGGVTPCTAATRPGTTLADGTPLFDEEACVPGAMFVFGSAVAFGRGDTSDVPQRAAILPPFRMDRYEVTVGRWRDALGRGFSPASQPTTNDAPIDFTSPVADAACTFSGAPMGRETLPMNCLTWAAARSFCMFEGGDLPTEAQREYVAMDAGRPAQTLYPWGDADPTCQSAVYARLSASSNAHATDCKSAGIGLAPEDAVAGMGGDVALGTGVVDLAGSLTELLLDTFASLDSACWASQPLTSPSCIDPSVQEIVLRGGSWADNSASLTGDVRGNALAIQSAPVAGFRCVRPVP